MSYYMETSIIDALLVKYPSYIVLLSGKIPELETITADVAKDLGFQYLCFNHIKSDYNPVNKRVEELLNKKIQGIIVCGPNFPSDKLGFKVNYHIHISNKGEKEKLDDNIINKFINVKPEYDVVQVADSVFDVIIAHVDSIVHKKYKD